MRIQLAVTTLAAASLAGLAAAQQPTEAGADTPTIEIRIEKREVVGESVIRVTRDQRVELVWQTDEAAELHIHGYDIRFDISPEAPARVDFAAHATGRFAVTSHGFGGEDGHGHDTLLYIEVHPK